MGRDLESSINAHAVRRRCKNAGDHKQNKIKNKKTNLKQKSNSTNFQNKKLIKTDRIWKLVTELKEKPVKSDNC
jgi:hypothetical protein